MPRGAGPQLPTVLLWLALSTIAAASTLAQAPEPNAGAYLPREEMIDNIVHFALVGDCQRRRNIFGPAFASSCRPDAGEDEPVRMMSFLDGLPHNALIEICRRNQIADCKEPKEVSKGRPILTLQSVFNVEFNSPKATWSPDGRLLLLDNLNPPAREVRLLDVAAGKLLDPPLYAGPLIGDAAWSPDGAYIALTERTLVYAQRNPALAAVRLYASATGKELARISAGDAGCSAGLAEGGMAFAANSSGLWLLCSHQTKEARAVKLNVPGLQAEESFLPPTPIPGWSESYWEDGPQRVGHDLIVTIRFATPKPVKGPSSAVQAFRLSTRQPLYPPMYVGLSRLADDLSGLYVGDELWSTQSGQRVATGVKPSGRYLGAPNRLPGLGLHIETRHPHKSLHGALAVVDSATGAAVQQIGPIPKVVTVLVSPDGTRVAVAGFRGIRFYRVAVEAATRG